MGAHLLLYSKKNDTVSLTSLLLKMMKNIPKYAIFEEIEGDLAIKKFSFEDIFTFRSWEVVAFYTIKEIPGAKMQ